MQARDNDFEQKPVRTLFLYTVLTLAILVFLGNVLKTIVSDRKMPSKTYTIHDRALRGKIISADHYTMSRSNKTYKATILKKSIDPKKLRVFTKLFSIYSGIPEKKIIKKMKKTKGYVVLSSNIDANSAIRLKSLGHKLRNLNVFKSIKNKNGVDILYGLDIIENGEERYFPLKDTLSPVLGYVRNKEDGKYTVVRGVKGLEREYQKYLNAGQDGLVQGTRDVTGNIIRTKSSITTPRIDGYDIHLNISLKLQRRVELILDQMKKKTGAKEIIAGVMESKTGKMITVASSDRFNPENIKKGDVYKLNPKFSEFLYEPGSVMKPISLSLAIDKGLVGKNSVFDTTDGKLRIGKKYVIRDDEVYDSQTATDIIVHSSNVGISKIVWLMNGKDFHDGLQAFGLGKRTGVDISRELPGRIKNVKLLSNKLHRANQAYGYGMYASFIQLLKAYSAFNNNGIGVTPRITDYLVDSKNHQYRKKSSSTDIKPIKSKTARTIKEILIDVVTRGTAKTAAYPGLEIGGKTGTAHIVKNGKYIKKYNSSFFGFANDDKGHKYTIGVIAIELSREEAKDYHFASDSAVPTFGKIVKALVETDYLKPNLTQAQLDKQRLITQRKKEALKKKQARTAQRLKRELKREREKMIRQEKEQKRAEKLKAEKRARKLKREQIRQLELYKSKQKNKKTKPAIQKHKSTKKITPKELFGDSQEPPPVEGLF